MRKRKLIVGILVFILMIIVFALLNTTSAASLGKLTITKERKVGAATYKHQLYSTQSNTRNVWKIVRSNNNTMITDPNNPLYLKDLYCLRAGLGFVTDAVTPEGKVVEYNQSFTISKRNVEESFNQLVTRYSGVTSETTLFKTQNKDKFYAVLWILDNMFLESGDEEALKEFLLDKTKGAGYTQSELDRYKLGVGGDKVIKNVLSRADIEAVQQLAIWYFANSDEADYNKEELPSLWLHVAGEQYSAFNTGTNSQGKDIYKILSDIYDMNIPDIEGETPLNIGGSWGKQRQTHANTLYKNLIKQAKAAVTAGGGKYTPKRDITVYLAGTNFAQEQPVVQVEESKGEADISLRKFISEVNGIKRTGIDSREPQVDTSNFNREVNGVFQTTAIYNHPKKPVPVKIGDTVTYTIRLYNEGEVDATIKEVTDYLPSYLVRTIPTGKRETETYWQMSEDGYVATTTENCKIVGSGVNLNYNNLS